MSGGMTVGALILCALGFRRPAPAKSAAPAAPQKPRDLAQRLRGASRQSIEDRLLAGAAREVTPETPTNRLPFDRRAAEGRPAIDSRALERHPIDVHVEQILLCFHHSAYQPGEFVPHDDMRAIYAHVCRELGWRPHKWNNLSRELKYVMGRGARGSIRPYRKIELPDGTERQTRGWIVPPRPSTLRDGRLGEAGGAATDSQSTPRDIRWAA
jgi:hypothetical protein